MATGEYRASLQKEWGRAGHSSLRGGGDAEQDLEGRIGTQWVARWENHS